MLVKTYIPKRFNYTLEFSIRTITDDTRETLIVLSDLCRILGIDSPSNIVRNMGLMHSVKSVKDDDGVRSYRYICIGESAVKAIADEYAEERDFFSWLLSTVYNRTDSANSVHEATSKLKINELQNKYENHEAVAQCLDSMIYHMVMLKNALNV